MFKLVIFILLLIVAFIGIIFYNWINKKQR